MNCCELLQPCDPKIKILAVILDLDGTLLNTEKATKDVLKEFLVKYGKVLDRKKEDNRLGMTQKEAAECIVKDYDLPMNADQFSKEIMPLHHQRWPQARALPGANRLIMHLRNKGVPFALASNSITKNIEEKISCQKGWKESFSAIVGSDQVNCGKPSPDIFLEAAKRMGVDAVQCLVIEDSLVGVMAAKAAGMKVVAVPSLQAQADHYVIADLVLHSLLEFQPELWGLPAFEDWLGNVLSIEPLYLQGQVHEGLLCEYPDDDQNALPDQVLGIYFGWVKLSAHKIFKVIVQCHSFATKRIIKPCFIGQLDKDMNGQHLQILLVGCIGESSSKENALKDLEIHEGDISVASEALDLPIFSHHMNNSLSAEAALFVDDNSASHDHCNIHKTTNVLLA